MTPSGFTLFDTAIGRCGVVWSAQGIVAVQLPQHTEEQTRARIDQRYPGLNEAAPPTQVGRAIDRIVALLAGRSVDLSDIALDQAEVSEFQRRVYAIARAIPPGNTLSYGDIAKRLGDVALSREVGQALGRNPCPIIVPCHRVLAAGDKPGGFSANGGVATKLKLLSIEGARVNYTPSLFD
ncbi:methylated-DNA--[protein]-cysteine S-methyltransferase [Rhodopseudomonas palustris]|uniref:Methylated-DNA--protein-cysteine methyltransferase n=1 Tax=Rhodopseudomonas palustris (strain BisB18) TaxID=316056 RepID=Q219M9_RHOPB